MWTVIINNQNNQIANVTATFVNSTTNFTYQSTIKVADTDKFVQAAKEKLADFLDLHKDDSTLKSTLETALNQ